MGYHFESRHTEKQSPVDNSSALYEEYSQPVNMDRMSLQFITSPTQTQAHGEAQKAAKALYGMLWTDSKTSPSASRPNTEPSSPNSDNGSTTPRSPRHQYDDEQAAYLLYLYYFYLKVEPRACWDKVAKLFEMRFPPGRPRRQQGRGLSREYETRQINGLNSKFYRLRDTWLPGNDDFESKKIRTDQMIRQYHFPPISTLVQWASQL